jgi:hypothetical protein
MPPAIPTATCARDLQARLQAFRQRVELTASPMDLGALVGPPPALDAMQPGPTAWRAHPTTGTIGRGDGLFFEVRGLEVRPQGPTAAACYRQPVLHERAPAGTVVLVCDRQTGDVLLDMKVEPGSDPQRQFTTLAPTLQVSSSRLALARVQGQDPALPLLGVLAGLGALDARATEVQQDGGRFLNKRTDSRVVFVEQKQDVDAAAVPSLLWARLEDLDDDLNINEGSAFLWQSLGLLAREQRRERAHA